MAGKKNKMFVERFSNEDLSKFDLYPQYETSSDWKKQKYGMESDHSDFDYSLYDYNDTYNVYNIGFQFEDDYDEYGSYKWKDVGLESESDYASMGSNRGGSMRTIETDSDYKYQQQQWLRQKHNRSRPNRKERKTPYSEHVNVYVANTFEGQQGFRQRKQDQGRRESAKHNFHKSEPRLAEEDVEISLRDRRKKINDQIPVSPVKNNTEMVVSYTQLKNKYKKMLPLNEKIPPGNDVNYIPLLLFQNRESGDSVNAIDTALGSEIVYLPVAIRNSKQILNKSENIPTMIKNNDVEKVAEKPLECTEIHSVSSTEEYLEDKDLHVSKENLKSSRSQNLTVYNAASSFPHLTKNSTTSLLSMNNAESKTSLISDQANIKTDENEDTQRTYANYEIDEKFPSGRELNQSTVKKRTTEGRTVNQVYVAQNDLVTPYTNHKNNEDEKKDGRKLGDGKKYTNNFINNEYLHNKFDSMPGIRYTVTRSSPSQEKTQVVTASSQITDVKTSEIRRNLKEIIFDEKNMYDESDFLARTPLRSNTKLLYSNPTATAPEVSKLLLSDPTQQSLPVPDVEKQEPSRPERNKFRKVKNKNKNPNTDDFLGHKDEIMRFTSKQEVNICYNTSGKDHSEVFHSYSKEKKARNSKKLEKVSKETPYIPISILGYNLTTLLTYCFETAQFLVGVSMHDKFVEILGTF